MVLCGLIPPCFLFQPLEQQDTLAPALTINELTIQPPAPNPIDISIGGLPESLIRFVTERCEVDPRFVVGASELYAAYRAWATAVPLTIVSQQAFDRALSKLGFKTKPGTDNKQLRKGLRLREDGESERSGINELTINDLGGPPVDKPIDLAAGGWLQKVNSDEAI